MHATTAVRAIIAAVAVAASFAIGSVLTHDSAGRTGSLVSASVERVDVPADATAAAASNDGDLAGWLDGVAEAEWYAGVQAEADRQAALAAAASPRSTTPGYHPGTTDDGECSGFSIPSYIIQRESGGNPSAYNPSGAYGCAQTLLSHYSRGSCQGLDPFTIQGQRDCVDILSNGGTNLAPWAATR